MASEKLTELFVGNTEELEKKRKEARIIKTSLNVANLVGDNKFLFLNSTRARTKVFLNSGSKMRAFCSNSSAICVGNSLNSSG